ncbi:hypothetical protein ACOMHN_048670 [Nucella lapillus]
MRRLAQSLVVLPLLLSTCTAFIVVDLFKKCPLPPVKQNFDVTRYIGKWWEYQRFPAPFEFAGTNGFANYTLMSSSSVKVVNSGIQKIKLFNVEVSRKPILAVGEAVVVNPAKPGELRVTFPQSPIALDGDKPNYFVVDTDYDNYSVVFSCTDFMLGNFQFLWILTRERGVKPARLADLHDTLRKAGVDLRPLITVDQGERSLD